MNSAAYQITGGIVDQPVAGDRVFAGKGGSDDVQPIVAATAAGTGVAGVQVRFVLDFQRLRLQGTEALAQTGNGVGAHQAGSTFLKGLIVTFS